VTGAPAGPLDAPPQDLRILCAGPLTVALDGIDLRYVRAGKVEVVRRIYAAVRDRNWNTVPGRVSGLEIDDRGDSFEIRYRVHHVSRDVDFAWGGLIAGDADGRISLVLDGAAGRDLLYNRIGFCVLHPFRETAGRPYRARTSEGDTAGSFPTLVGPQRFENGVYLPLFPSFDRLEIDLADGSTARFAFEGDLWETEDQRNWTDASFKTYCTPIKLGFPHELREGGQVVQRVDVSVAGIPPKAGTQPRRTEPVLRIGKPTGRTAARLGLAAPSDGVPAASREIELLRALDLDHLRAEARLAEPGWEARLDSALELRRQLDVELELAVFLRPEHERELDRLAARVAGVPIARVLVVPGGAQTATPLETTPVGLVQLVRRHLGAAPITGGTDLNFCELNRTRPEAERMDGIFYPIHPQVHAFDDISLVETLEAQADTVETALTFARGKPVIVSPITLKRRFNAVATAEEPGPGEGELPDPVDQRQPSLLAAAWTNGSVKYLSEAGASSLTYFETTGWRGVLERESGSPLPERFRSRAGEVFPLYHVLGDLGALKGGALLECRVDDPLAAVAVAVVHGDGTTVLVSSLQARPQTVRVEGLAGPARIRRLNSETAAHAAANPEAFRHEHESLDDPGALALLPFETVRVDVSGSGA
jgi:D-apionolactonase